jgi:hypothetical protein
MDYKEESWRRLCSDGLREHYYVWSLCFKIY